MKLSKVLFLFIIIATVVNMGTALFCYGCLASTDSDCFSGSKKSYVIQDCQAAQANVLSIPGLPQHMNHTNGEPPIKTVCVQFTQPDFSPKAFTRGCGFIWENVDICEYLQNLTQIEGCSYCENHFCNFQPGTSF